MRNSNVTLPFRYPGGKYYAMNILEPFWDSVEHTEYREPFAGGATVFFTKPKAKINWLFHAPRLQSVASLSSGDEAENCVHGSG